MDEKSRSGLEPEIKVTMIKMALEARKNSYSPYSHFQVGACLLTKEGRLYTGCNIENAAYGPTNCAERTAFFKAVSEGERDFAGIAIVGDKEGTVVDNYAFPCGVCRQVMTEFTDPETFVILVAKSEKDYLETTLAALLPNAFGPEMKGGNTR